MMSLQKFKDELSKSIYGKTTADAVESGCCIQCGKPAIERCYSTAGVREFGISGSCEVCFDKITGEGDDVYTGDDEADRTY